MFKRDMMNKRTFWVVYLYIFSFNIIYLVGSEILFEYMDILQPSHLNKRNTDLALIKDPKVSMTE